MRAAARSLALAAAATMALPAAAAADHADRPSTSNMHALGHSPNPATFLGAPDGERRVSSDLAFWGDLVYAGTYDGFRILRRDPGDPAQVSRTTCNGDQGDVVVWDDVLVRSWNSKKTSARQCDGETVPAGWEGVHVFDVSNPADPELVGAVELPCGSHTVTGAKDPAANRLVVYSNNSSSSGCTGGGAAGDFMDVIEVPLDAPEGASLLRREALEGPTGSGVSTGCHDAGVILGEVNLMACASSDTTNVFDVGDNDTAGGSLEDPELLYTVGEPGVGIGGRWHSAAFSFDGDVLVLGWEPGGGAAPQCKSSDEPVKKSAFFYDARTGTKLGQWTLPRPQDGAEENCTIHNYNVVPLRSDRRVLTLGNYQAGTWVVDFSDPANARTLGWSDPEALDPPDLGGAWSSYWYNGFIYESSITEGVNVFRFSGRETAGARRLDHLNPQTQEHSQ